MIPVYYSARSLLARRVSTSLTVLGLGLVVFVLAAVLMLSRGIEQALASGGSAANAIVLREGATSEIVSGVDHDAFRVLQSSPEIATGSDGAPLAAGERVVLVNLVRPGGFSNITVRGIDRESFELRPGVLLVEGRAPRPGSNELVIGNALAGRFDGAFVGGTLRFVSQDWQVVGRFVAKGSAYESEVWADGTRVSTAFERPDYSSATFRLRSADAFEPFKQRVESDRRFQLVTKREDRYWEEQGTGLAAFIRVLGLFVAFVFSVGAVLGAMITMYAQVASRVRELATLRALGFRRRSVLATVLIESALLGAAGAAIGVTGALFMGFVNFTTLNFQTFSEVRFRFTPTPGIVAASLLFGTALGLIGGALPSLRAARLQVLDAMRAA